MLLGIVITTPTSGQVVEVDEGNSAVLSCTARGSPTPSIMWSPDTDNTTTVATSQTTDDQGLIAVTSNITILNIQRNIRPYTCTAQNSAGSLSRSFSFTVYCKFPIPNSYHQWFNYSTLKNHK